MRFTLGMAGGLEYTVFYPCYAVLLPGLVCRPVHISQAARDSAKKMCSGYT